MTDARAAAPASIGVFGGTFDPVHFGHLRTAYEVMQAVPLAEVRFIPAADPPHRAAPLAPAEQRLALVHAAVADQPGFVVDDRELRRAGPSYTVLTLGELRAEYPDVPVCLIMGMDAFQGLPTWHRWQELLELAHVVVAPRPGWTEPATGPLAELLATRRAPGRRALLERAAGYVHVEPVTQLEISSSELRELLAAGRDPRYLVPDAVRAELRRTQCYSVPRPTR